MKTILITGATGFIGKKLINKFLQKKYNVIAATRNPYKLAGYNNKNLEIIKFDLKDKFDYLLSIKKEIDVLCHTAAFIPKDFNNQSLAETCFKINSLGTQKLLDFAVEKNIEQFIYFNSGNAYDYSDKPVKEDDKLYPSKKATYYLGSKLMGELYVDHYRQKDILNATIFRLSSVYGSGMKENEFIYNCIKKLSNSEKIEIYNNDIYKTDFVYVNDIVKATILSIENDNFGIFNIGSGKNYSLGFLAETLTKIMNKSEDLIDIMPIKDINKVQKGFPALDMNKTKSIIGIKPTSLKNGLKNMINEIDI